MRATLGCWDVPGSASWPPISTSQPASACRPVPQMMLWHHRQPPPPPAFQSKPATAEYLLASLCCQDHQHFVMLLLTRCCLCRGGTASAELPAGGQGGASSMPEPGPRVVGPDEEVRAREAALAPHATSCTLSFAASHMHAYRLLSPALVVQDALYDRELIPPPPGAQVRFIRRPRKGGCMAHQLEWPRDSGSLLSWRVTVY